MATVGGVGAMVFWEKLTPKGVFGVQTYRDELRMQNKVRTLTTMQPYIANGNCGDLITTTYS